MKLGCSSHEAEVGLSVRGPDLPPNCYGPVFLGTLWGSEGNPFLCPCPKPIKFRGSSEKVCQRGFGCYHKEGVSREILGEGTHRTVLLLSLQPPVGSCAVSKAILKKQ